MASYASRLDQWVPGVRVAGTYQRRWLRPDLIAGIVLAAILVPQGMAYAELAGLPPVTGLYATIGCLIGYAMFGPSRILVLGPDSSVSPMIFAAIMPLLAGGDSSRAIALAGMLALMVGLIEVGLGLGRLGFVADLLSNEVQVGYMNGLALIIIVGQLPKLFGYSTKAAGLGAELIAFAADLDKTVGAALLVGLGVLAILLVLPRITRRVPAVLVGIAGATVISAVLDLSERGVATVGALPEGSPGAVTPVDKSVGASDPCWSQLSALRSSHWQTRWRPPRALAHAGEKRWIRIKRWSALVRPIYSPDSCRDSLSQRVDLAPRWWNRPEPNRS